MAASWLKTGEASAAIAQQEKVEQIQRQEERGKLWRFFMNRDEECQITFIDGELSDKGLLLPPRYYEHNLKLNGKWGNVYVCPEKTAPQLHEKCPICASGDQPTLVSLFTVIDHRSYTSQKGVVYKDTQKLFVAKSGTMEILNKIAVKRGGLAGVKFDVSRTGEKAPAVGTMFDFVRKDPVEELKPQYMREFVDPKTNAKTSKCIFVPADYEHEITFKTGEELAALGFGVSVPGYSSGPASTSSGNFADQM